MQTRGREQVLARGEEVAFGQVFPVRQGVCPWVRTQDQRDSEEPESPGVWVGGLGLESMRTAVRSQGKGK